MSWQAYVDTSLIASGHVDQAAIISVAGDSVWATSSGLSPAEMKAIAAIVTGDTAAKDKAFADGLYIGGTRFVVARAEDRSIYARSGRNGVAIAKTTQAIIVAHHGEAQVAGSTTATVEALADYLIGVGY
ncbi:profilin-like protein [Dactylonectria estremocensis]|uniref:Profilin n=1 Tax=Dactylonectria estremocensis TaxID=1079267 RepID=A0A9P9EWA7_9HYPO|nr:profilin-like protein [Dactylonectria estremocensis]